MEFERDSYLSVIDVSPESAAHFFGGTFFKIVNFGPVPPDRAHRFKPEARVFHCIPTEADWIKYQEEHGPR